MRQRHGPNPTVDSRCYFTREVSGAARVTWLYCKRESLSLISRNGHRAHGHLQLLGRALIHGTKDLTHAKSIYQRILG